MIPLSSFNMLAAVSVVLMLYSFIDTRNKYYGNIVSAFISSLVSGFLAVVVSIGIVQYDPVVTDTQCTSCAITVLDPAMGYVMLLFSVITMIYGLFMIYEAYVEYKVDREDEP